MAKIESSSELARRAIQRRAVEAVVWGMPAVNFELMAQALTRDAKGRFNEIVFWSKLLDWRNQTLTPNTDSVYFLPFIDTREVGPMVLEVPSADGGAIVGSIMDVWQTPLEDVGIAGVDQGRGGKYLIVGPGFNGETPPGYIVLPSVTHQSYALVRSIPVSASEADVAKAVAYGKRVKLYPLSRVGGAVETTFVDAVNVVFDSTIPYDRRFFRALDSVVQREPWLQRDRVMIDQLKTIGISQGVPYRPSPDLERMLDEAADEARAWLDAQYESVCSLPFFEGSRWTFPVTRETLEGLQSTFAAPESYPVDGRGLTYTFAFFAAKHLGAGSYYLMATRDRDGNAFDGSRSYKLEVPAAVPVKQYWSATVYDRNSHTLIREVTHSSRSSLNPALQKNADGSVDLYFAPAAVAGKESNWVPTRPGASFEVLFRFYGPERTLFEKTWRLPDIAPLR